MKQKFLSSLFLMVLLNLLVKPFYILGIDAEVQNRVGEEVYGNYYALLNFSFLLNILLDLGLTNYNTKNIAQHPQLLAKHFAKILSLRFMLFLLYATFTLLSGAVVGYSLHEFYLLSILLVNQFLVAIIQFSRSNFAGLHLFKTDAFISILDRSLLILFVAVLLWSRMFDGVFKIEWFIYAQTLAYGITALFSIALLRKKIGKLALKVKKTFSAAILRKSLPYALLIFLMMMYNRVDAVMLERICEDGDVQAGIYAQGFRFLDAVNMFALLFAGLLLPIFSRLLKHKDDITEMLNLAFKILGGLAILTALICFNYKDELILLRYPTSGEVAANSFGFLILSFIPVAITYVFGTLLTANGSMRQLNMMAVFGLLLNVTLNFIFIHSMKAEGAAIATLITQFVTALIQIVLVYRLLKLPFKLPIYGQLVALAGIMLGVIYGLKSTDLAWPILLQCAALFVFGIVLCFVLRLFSLSDLKGLLASKTSK
ncbi:MAG: oligosaccharide flippase family protein [Crocinitomicaceae bacterium]